MTDGYREWVAHGYEEIKKPAFPILGLTKVKLNHLRLPNNSAKQTNGGGGILNLRDEKEK